MQGERTILELLAPSFAAHPDKIAVEDPSHALTYAELGSLAKRLGAALLEKLPGSGQTPVMVFADKSCEALVMLLGCLCGGHPYVPMDTKTPADRLQAIADTLGTSVMLCSEADTAAVRELGWSGPLYIYEELLACDADLSLTEEAAARALDTDLAYILFTSGSTGVPKGVAIRHRSLLDYIIHATDLVGIRESDVVGNQTPFYADMSLKDIYMTLAKGGTLCLIPQKYFMTPKKLLAYLDERRVTFLAWVPTAYRIIAQFDALSKLRPASLRRFVFSGEVMPIPVFRYWKRFYPEAGYAQLYGPTEITGACTYMEVTRDYEDGEQIPIGRPFPNTGISLRDENGAEVQPGMTGEITVFGSCLAAGYYRNPEKTAAAFVPDPLSPCSSLMYRTGDLAYRNEDGDLVFVSRRDWQIKHAGRRIELGEIDAAAMSLDGVAAACAVHNRARDIIGLYYIGEADTKTLLAALKQKLPPYMVPASLMKETALPMLQSGKTDRKRLDTMFNTERGTL